MVTSGLWVELKLRVGHCTWQLGRWTTLYAVADLGWFLGFHGTHLWAASSTIKILMIGYEVLIDRLSGTLSIYRTKKTTAMAHLMHALAEKSFKNRSIGLVGLTVSLKNDRNGRGLPQSERGFEIFACATALLETPFYKSWIRHCYENNAQGR